jgi:hypothetical protein
MWFSTVQRGSLQRSAIELGLAWFCAVLRGFARFCAVLRHLLVCFYGFSVVYRGLARFSSD